MLNAVLAADAAPNPWFDPGYVTDNWSTIVGYLGQHRGRRQRSGERRQ